MDVEKFLEHHGIRENPFGAEEARHDPVFERLTLGGGMAHPEMIKILGNPDRPNTSVVFGEKGSGKTALRLLMARRIVEHNETSPDRRTLLVAYDDFNPILDTMGRNKARTGARRARDPDRLLASFRLEDHQDAILSGAVTKIVNALLGAPEQREKMMLPSGVDDKIKSMPRETRLDLLCLAALYDAPRGKGGVLDRWQRLRKKLGFGFSFRNALLQGLAALFTVLAAGLLLANIAKEKFGFENIEVPAWSFIAGSVLAAIAAVLWLGWLGRRMRIWRAARQLVKECPSIDRDPAQMRSILADIAPADRAAQVWPRRGGDGTNARYELTAKLLQALLPFGHNAIVVLVDRVDEPTLVAGRPERMRRLVWPMFDSKFLQQDGIGLKLLLPLELRYLILKEDATFFQEARLDKQSLVDRLAWTGAILYDLCSARLRACHGEKGSQISLTDLFEEGVGREALVDALGQMQQPRDAFKMMYAVLLEHCRNVPAEEPEYRIPRLTLETVRREQANRIQELQKGLSPA
ncbi:MAG: hypothetical protein AAGD14_02730 [Planctomycetota bacterium]